MQVDMPVFFYIDPEFMEDPKMARYDELILSYTFFQSNEESAPGASPHTPHKPPSSPIITPTTSSQPLAVQ